MPIHRLNEKPTRQAVLSDITCDCDGKIDQFIDLHDVQEHACRVHDAATTRTYISASSSSAPTRRPSATCTTCFGDTNVVSVQVDDDGEIAYEQEINGDSVADVLTYVEYQPAGAAGAVPPHRGAGGAQGRG